MKSEDIPFYRILLHIIGFHWYGTWRTTEDYIYYRNCEICGFEKVCDCVYCERPFK